MVTESLEAVICLHDFPENSSKTGQIKPTQPSDASAVSDDKVNQHHQQSRWDEEDRSEGRRYKLEGKERGPLGTRLNKRQEAVGLAARLSAHSAFNRHVACRGRCADQSKNNKPLPHHFPEDRSITASCACGTQRLRATWATH